MSVKSVGPMIAIALLVIMFTSFVPAGFAVSSNYTSVAVNSNNTLGADYFTVGLYKYYDDDTYPDCTEFDSNSFNPVGSASVAIGDSIKYSVDGGDWAISAGSYNVIYGNIFIVIFGDHSEYHPDLEIKLFDGDVELPSNDYYVTISLGNDAASIESGFAYSISINVVFPDSLPISSGCESLTAKLFFTVNTVVSGDFSLFGIYYQSDTIVLAEAEIDIDEIEIETEGYDSKPTMITIHGSEYDAIQVVQNDEGGIAEDGKIDVTVLVPKGKQFCIFIEKQKTTAQLRINLDVTLDGVPYHKLSTMTMAADTSYYTVHDGSLRYCTAAQINSHPEWWTVSNSEIVTIQITDDRGDVPDSVKLGIVFLN